MRTANEVIFTAADMSTTQTSAALSVNQVFGFAAQFEFTGSPVGSMKIQCSSDPYGSPQSAPIPSNWTDVADSAESISAAGNLVYNVSEVYYNWVRFVYTASSGSGSMNGRLNLKGF